MNKSTSKKKTKKQIKHTPTPSATNNWHDIFLEDIFQIMLSLIHIASFMLPILSHWKIMLEVKISVNSEGIGK